MRSHAVVLVSVEIFNQKCAFPSVKIVTIRKHYDREEIGLIDIHYGKACLLILLVAGSPNNQTGHMTYFFLLKHHRGVEIENQLATKCIAARSALQYDSFHDRL